MLISRLLFKTAMLFAIAFGSIGLPYAAHSADYPVVFTSSAPLRKIGIAVEFGESGKPFNNKCYVYGEGSTVISMSDEFLSRFLAKGFTVQSTCLGLISETHYDPESGRRLPTYMIVDRKAIEARSEDLGIATEELPLELPPCFKNAHPYTDCVFRYGRKTGKKLSDEETEIYRKLGAAIEAILVNALRGSRPASDEIYSASEDAARAGYRKAADLGLPDGFEQLGEPLQRYSSYSFWVRSTKLPGGFGYALDADGSAGPSLSAEAMNAAISGIAKSQMSADDLKRALDARK